jgi:hypothetical protein
LWVNKATQALTNALHAVNNSRMEETVQHGVRYDLPTPTDNRPGPKSSMTEVARSMKPGGCRDKLTHNESIALMTALKRLGLGATRKKEGHTFTVWRLEKKGER